MRILLALMITAASLGRAGSAELSAIAARSPKVMLLPVYHSYQLRPCQYYGFSFDDCYSELKQMRDVGATTVGTNRIWTPVQDPDAPNGDGYTLEGPLSGGVPLAQSFKVGKAFNSVAVCAPTFFSAGSGLTLALYRLDDKDARQQVASKMFGDVVDNSWLALELDAQPSGNYIVEASDPTGERIGLWARAEDVYADGQAFVSGKAVPDADFVLRVRYEDDTDYTEIVPDADGHVSVQLGLDLWESLRELGMYSTVAVGDWNNGLFPYYPDWYYEKYPDFCMVDQNGKRVEATMFDKPKGWPPIDHPQQIQGCARFTTAVVSHLKNERIPMWVLGGEELYPTYCFPDRWADYQTNALAHFREWCRVRYGDISKLNAVWFANYSSFDEIESPKQPAMNANWADWMDFRFRAMAERFVWLYQAVLKGDTSRLAITANHGDIYHGFAAPYMGMQPDIYASVSDGFETGQIMEGGDPWYFNLMYADTLNPLGKPVSPNRLAYKFPDPKARGGGKSYTPEKARRYAYESLGSGAWFLGLIQWRGSLPDGEWGMKGTPAIDEVRKVFSELEALAPYLQHTYPIKPELGVYVSHYTWSLMGFDEAWRDVHVGLIERQVPKSFLYDDSDWSGYRAVLSVNNPIISSTAVGKIRSYIEDGGTFVIVGRFYEKDETVKPFAKAIFEGAGQPTLIPGLNGWAAKLGKGVVLWLAEDVQVTLADRVVRLLEALEIPKPTSVESRNTITREAELPAESMQLSARDLCDIDAVGQTFTAPGVLKEVRFRTPTYRSKVEKFSLRARIMENGPDGKVLAQTVIPADELTDNSWHAVPVETPVASGAKLYLEIESPAGLPASHLGVWTGKDDDWYPDGQLYVDGGPGSGDMQFGLKFADTVPASRVVEAFTLMDGLNYVQVLVNTSASPVSVRVGLDGALVACPDANYHIRDAVSGTHLGKRRGDSIKYGIELPPNGTAAVLVMYDASQAEAEKAVAAAGSAARHWQNLGKQYGLTYRDSAADALKRGQYAKAVALAAKTVSALGISASAEKKDSDLVLTARVVDSGGKPVTNALVEAAVNPAFGLTVRLTHRTDGKYSARIPQESLPRVYDYAARKYVPLSGPVTIDVTARRGAEIGAVRISSAL